MNPNRVQKLQYFPPPKAKKKTEESAFDSLITRGLAVLVPAVHSRAFFQAGRVAIASDIYERYVVWGSAAMRDNQICLEERDRLQSLLKDAYDVKRHAAPAYFSHKGIASDAGLGMAHRCGLVLKLYDKQIDTGWLITR